MIRLLYIPVTFKNIILGISGATYWMFIVCLVVDHLFFGSMFILLGLQLTSLGQSHTDKKFSDMSFLERMKVVSVYALILLTIASVIFIGIYSRRKMTEIEARKK